MCGFVAYVGKEEASPILLEALGRLGERGHHAAGLVVQNGTGLERVRVRGRVSRLGRLLRLRPVAGTSGIGHVRWLTDEPATVAGAQPHVDCHGELAVAVVGGVDLGPALGADLERRGHVLRCSAPSEVLAHVIEDVWVPPFHLALARALERAQGRFAVAALSSREPGRIVVASRGVSLLIGRRDGATFAVSEEAGLLPGTRSGVRLQEGEMAVLDASGYDVLRTNGLGRIRRSTVAIHPRAPLDGARGLLAPGEDPADGLTDAIADTVLGRLARDGWMARLGELAEVADPIRRAGALVLVAGSGSRPAARIGAEALREFGRLETGLAAARYVARATTCRPTSVVAGVARAGEEAPLRRALRSASRAGVPAFVLDGGPPARDRCFEGYPRLGVRAGPDVGGGRSRSFVAEVVTFALLALWCGRLRGLPAAERRALLEALERLPYAVEGALGGAAAGAAALAGALRGRGRVRLVGSGYGFAAAREGARWLRRVGHEAIGVATETAEDCHAPADQVTALLFACSPGEARALAPAASRLSAAGCMVAAVVPEGSVIEGARLTLVVPRTLPLLQPILSLLPLQSLQRQPAVGASGAAEMPALRAGVA